MPGRGEKEGGSFDGSFLSSFLWLIPVNPQAVNSLVLLGVLPGRPGESQITHLLAACSPCVPKCWESESLRGLVCFNLDTRVAGLLNAGMLMLAPCWRRGNWPSLPGGWDNQSVRRGGFMASWQLVLSLWAHGAQWGYGDDRFLTGAEAGLDMARK